MTGLCPNKKRSQNWDRFFIDGCMGVLYFKWFFPHFALPPLAASYMLMPCEQEEANSVASSRARKNIFERLIFSGFRGYLINF
jgi:hypothetical protein